MSSRRTRRPTRPRPQRQRSPSTLRPTRSLPPPRATPPSPARQFSARRRQSSLTTPEQRDRNYQHRRSGLAHGHVRLHRRVEYGGAYGECHQERFGRRGLCVQLAARPQEPPSTSLPPPSLPSRVSDFISPKRGEMLFEKVAEETSDPPPSRSGLDCDTDERVTDRSCQLALLDSAFGFGDVHVHGGRRACRRRSSRRVYASPLSGAGGHRGAVSCFLERGIGGYSLILHYTGSRATEATQGNVLVALHATSRE